MLPGEHSAILSTFIKLPFVITVRPFFVYFSSGSFIDVSKIDENCCKQTLASLPSFGHTGSLSLQLY